VEGRRGSHGEKRRVSHEEGVRKKRSEIVIGGVLNSGSMGCRRGCKRRGLKK